MALPNNLSKEAALILGLLSQLPGWTGRTKFVKLVYLVDNMHAEHLGASITGFRYHWDNYGPNAVGNGIVATLESLSEHGLVRQFEGSTPQYGSKVFNYRVSPEVNPSGLPLSADDWMFIRAVIKKHGRENRDRVVRAAKATLPMKGATQYDSLTLQSKPEIQERGRRILSNAKLMAQVDESLQSREPDISLEELKASYAEPPDH